MALVFDSTVKDVLNERLLALEKHFDADLLRRDRARDLFLPTWVSEAALPAARRH